MKIDAKDANGYVAAVDPVRRPHLERVRALVKETVPQATEAILHGMLGYSCDGRLFASLGAQKNYLSLYLCDLSTQPELRATHGEALARLKMGKSCINFTSTDDLPFDTLAAILAAAPHVAGRAVAVKKTAGKKAAPARAR